MSSADEKGCFTLTWEIENIGFFLFSDNGELTSAAWKTETTDECALWWFISAYLSESNIEIVLRCLNKNLIPDECEISFISSSGDILQQQPANQYTHCMSLTVKKDFLYGNKMHSKISQDTLTLDCKMWKKAMKNGEFRIHTVVQKVDFCWNIKNQEECRPNTWPYFQKTFTGKDVLLIMDLHPRSSKDNNYNVCAVTQPMIDGCFSFVICKIICHGLMIGKRTEYEGWYNQLRTEWRKDIVIPKTNFDFILRLQSIVAYHKNGHNQITRPTSSQIMKTMSIHEAVIGGLSEDLLHLYRESILSDATLHSDGKSFSAHKSILAARSLVFRAMFKKNEMNEGRSGVVDIDDVDSETMDRMLVFLYGGSLEGVQWEEASTLYYAADKYDVLSLKKICAEILIAGLSVSNACDALALADKHSDEQLIKCVVNFINDHQEVVSSPSWEELERSNSRLTSKIATQLFLKRLQK